MKTLIFTFTEPGHVSTSEVTAETVEECWEKYYLKYPERKGPHNHLTAMDPEWNKGGL